MESDLDSDFRLRCSLEQQWIAGNTKFAPLYIPRRDILPLIANKQSRSQKGKLDYSLWLNCTTIDAITLFVPSFTPPQPIEKKPFEGAKREYSGPRLRSSRKKTNNNKENESGLSSSVFSNGAMKIYLGSSFNEEVLQETTDSYCAKLRSLLEGGRELLMILNTGQHWCLLTFTQSQAVLFDPMHSSSVSASILLFCARVYSKVDELITALPLDSFQGRRMGRLGSISVRSKLSRVSLSFFALHNVAVQVREEEGFNCGLYCSLWARAALHVLPSLSLLPQCLSNEPLALPSQNHVIGLSVDEDDSDLRYTRSDLETLRHVWMEIFTQRLNSPQPFIISQG